MKTPKEIPLRYPVDSLDVKHWLVYGLDPSMSRTGYALMRVSLPPPPVGFSSSTPLREGEPCSHPGCLHHVSHPCEGCGRVAGRGNVVVAADALPVDASRAEWLSVGSVKPQTSADPIWIRGKGMALYLKSCLSEASTRFYRSGLLISMEYPTPMNDFLVALNRIIHLVFFEGDLWKAFSDVRVLTTNASTLRSLMGLSKTGRANKSENILRAYEFIDQAKWPSLDPDSCDAVLLAMMGRHAASILMGREQEVPERFRLSLCSDLKIKKGKGRNEREVTAGILHRPEYFYRYAAKDYTVCVRDAFLDKKAGLVRVTHTI